MATRRGGPAPIFSTNGDISMNGAVVATLSADGVLRTATGQEMAVSGLDGSAAINGLRLRFGADGMLEGGNPDGPGITLAPADSPAKRLAMTVIIMTLTVRNAEAGPVEQQDPAAPQ